MVIHENFGIKDIIDIVLVAILMYQAYRLVRKSGSSAIFKGVLAFLILWLIISPVLQMRLLGSILDKFLSVGLIVVIFLFQDEIRQFLVTLGENKTFRWIVKLFKGSDVNEVSDKTSSEIVEACVNMSRSFTGALIVIKQDQSLERFKEIGEVINADVNSRLIENIFFKNSPLHDGAMIIAGSKIRAVGCILPISHNLDMPKYLGLRHRAALGIATETDAKVIVISEERGHISFVSKGSVELNITSERLYDLLIGKAEYKE